MSGSSTKLRVVAGLERGAGLLRRAGLGGLVDRVASLTLPSLGPFTTEVGGLVLSGAHLGHQHYVRELAGGREGTMLRLLREATPPGARVLDGGAYLGWVALQAAQAAGPSGRVTAVEPVADTAGLLRRNVDANRLSGRVEVVSCALGAANGRARLHVSAGGDASSLYNSVGEIDVVEVEVRSGDDLLGDDAVLDVAKLDLEGGELEALRGLERTIARSRERLTLFVECNPELLAGAGASPGELAGWLRDAGFDVGWIDEAAGVVVPWGSRPFSGYVNLVCRPAGAPRDDGEGGR